MAIDRSGKYWKSSAPNDLYEYLSELSADPYPITEFRLAVCRCGSETFQLEVDADESVARRICVTCNKEHFICDSAEFWPMAEPIKYCCIICKNQETNVGIGFRLYKNRQAVHWLYIGCRCSKCGILSCIADWKVGYEPSLHLLSLA